MHGQICWNELNTWKAEVAKSYYGKVFGWTFEEMPGKDNEASYWIAQKDGEKVAGIFTLNSPDFDGIPDHWFTYLEVQDLDKALEAHRSSGGAMMRDPFEIPGMGTIAVVRDATGAAFAMFEPVK